MLRVIGGVFWTLVWLVTLAVLLLLAFRVWAAWRETGPVAVPVEGRMIETTLGAVYVEEAGAPDAPAVLLVHGSVGWARMWQPTEAALAAGYRAIAFDLAPMGFSARDPAADYSRPTQAARIVALVRALDVRPVLVAHSFGAGPAAEAAMIAPQDFAGLVVVDGAIALNAAPRTLPVWLAPVRVREALVAATITNPLASSALLKSFLYRKDVVTPEMIAMLQRPMNQPGSTTTLARWLPYLLVPPTDAQSVTEAGWQGLAVPVAVIWGARDMVTPLPQGQALATLTDAALFVLPEVGHIPQIEDPAAFHAALLDALSAVQ